MAFKEKLQARRAEDKGMARQSLEGFLDYWVEHTTNTDYINLKVEIPKFLKYSSPMDSVNIPLGEAMAIILNQLEEEGVTAEEVNSFNIKVQQ